MMLVADLIASGHARPVLTLPPDACLAEALDAMVHGRATAAIILDSDGACGILTRGDLLRGLARRPGAQNREGCGSLPEIRLGDIMSTDLLTAEPEKTLSQAIEHMTRAGIEHLPVVEKGRVVTLLHLGELLEEQLRLLNAEVTHLQQYIETLHQAEKD